VNFNAMSPDNPEMMFGQRIIDNIPPGGVSSVYTNWKAPTDGIYIIKVEANPAVLKENTQNNAATRAIIVGQYESGKGAISGQVIDTQGGVGSGVLIRASDASGMAIGSAATDNTGFYLIPKVPVGDYQVQASSEVKAVHVADQSVSTVDFVLPIDTTPPVITPTVSGTLGNNGWYTSDVTVSWSMVDNESPITSKSGCDTSTVTTDTAGVTFTCSATSSGGTVSKSVTIQRDATAPTITGSASPAANANGWNNSAVTVSFACNDATSKIATCTPPLPQTLSGEGANQAVSGAATDNAGNSASAQVIGINIDLTLPVVSVTGVTNGAIYTIGSVPAAGCTTTDALSGVQTNATLSVTGGNSDGTGTFTASCTGAMDKAGNTGAASVTYQVNAPAPSAFTFSAFSINSLAIDQRLKTFLLLSNFTLGQGSNGINPAQETVTLTIANFATTIPAGSFRKVLGGVYAFAGKINNVSIEALITPLGGNRFGFQAAAYGANLSGTKNPVAVGLTIGDDSGITSVSAVIK